MPDNTNLLYVGNGVEQIVPVRQLCPVQQQDVVVVPLQICISNHVAAFDLHRLNIAVQVEHCRPIRVKPFMVQQLDTLIQPDNIVIFKCRSIEEVYIHTIQIAFRFAQAKPQSWN